MQPKNERHEVKRTLIEDDYVPGHGEREEPLFKASRHQLIVVEKKTCWLCGTSEQLEAHHSPIEFSEANDVDFGPGSNIRLDFPQFDWAAFDRQGGDPNLFIDSVHNLMILCKPCHIGKNRGIHAKTHPNWVLRRYAKKDVALTPQDEKGKPL